MTVNLTDLKAKAEAATPDWSHRTSEADAAYIAAVSPAAMLPLIKALIEWREAWVAFDNSDDNSPAWGEALYRTTDADEALLALISGTPAQETNNDAG